jgi:hypothetical protein
MPSSTTWTPFGPSLSRYSDECDEICTFCPSQFLASDPVPIHHDPIAHCSPCVTLGLTFRVHDLVIELTLLTIIGFYSFLFRILAFSLIVAGAT